MKNSDVVYAWANNRNANTQNLRTDGSNLYSYALKIGYTDGHKKVAIDHTSGGGSFYSSTTSRHVSLAKQKSDVVEKP